MAVRIQHDQNTNSFYFITFTCHKWLNLFQETNAYDTVYKWFDHLFIMAYEIIKRQEESGREELLDVLHGDVKKREAKKGQIHKVFEDSFDAKQCYS